jgi:hypothetical protein
VQFQVVLTIGSFKTRVDQIFKRKFKRNVERSWYKTAGKTLLGITINRNNKCCVQKRPKGEQTAIANLKLTIIK